MGALPALLLAAATATAPAAAQERDALRFDGPSASATVDGGPGALRVGGAVHEGTGSAFLRGEDRVRARELTYGDSGELWLRLRAGGDVYRVELDAVGFPPAPALPQGPPRKWWRREEEWPRRPERAVEGGVVLGRVVNGGSGLGVRDMPAQRAAVELWGVGRLYKNDELVARRARILAQAVRGEAASREGALRARGQGEPPELDVFVDHLPPGVTPAGFFHFMLEGASIVESPAKGPATAQREEGAKATRRETREERMARPPTIDEQWNSGADMVAWSPAAPGAGPAGGAAGAPAEPASGGGPAYGAGPGKTPAPVAVSAPGAAYGTSPGMASNASAASVAVPPGTQTVIQPPPPLMAVPATPNTAPIQYESGQNGGDIGNALIGGGFGPGTYGGALAAATLPGAPVGTGIFAQTAPQPSGMFSGMNTPAPASATPAPGTPGAPTAPAPGFASAGIPATPAPLNAQPAPVPGASPPIGSVPALPGTSPVTGLPQLTNQLPAQTQPAPAPAPPSAPAAGAAPGP